MENNLGVGGTFTADSTGSELAAEFVEVIDLPVEGDYMTFILKRLSAAIVQPDDAEPGMGQAEIRIGPKADRIGTAPAERA